MSKTDEATAAVSGSEFGYQLSPLPAPDHFSRIGDCEYRDYWNAQQVRLYALAEVQRAVGPLRAELLRIQAYIDETPDLFEALGPIDCGPSVALSRARNSLDGA